jgi:integrase
MKLTDAFLRTLKGSGKARKHADGGGLYVYVTPKGSRLWRMSYRFDGKANTLSFGAYPLVSLKDARTKRDAAKLLLLNGKDPSEEKKAEKTAAKNTFESVAAEWTEKKRMSWTPIVAQQIRSRIERFILPAIGTRPVTEITAPEILNITRKLEEQGAKDTPRRIVQHCGQIFRYAIATGKTDRNPATDLQGALQTVKTTNHASIKDPKEIGELLRRIDGYNKGIVIRAALRLLPHVFVRNSELREAKWTEFNFEKEEWRIPAERMKMRLDHIVPLSRQSMKILQELEEYTGGERYPFTVRQGRPFSADMLQNALSALDYPSDVMTIHGFRSMASTLLNERGYNWDWIERQLAHSPGGVRAIYNYADYLPERRKMMQEWSDYLDRLRDGKEP